MKKDLFKPEDFENDGGLESFSDREIAADFANEKLNSLLKSSPTLYGYGIGACLPSIWNMNKQGDETHSAYLMFTKELPKEPCKHEPGEYDVHWKNSLCKHCHVELQATWSEKK